jgi:phosphate transport system substrate-binding protein
MPQTRTILVAACISLLAASASATDTELTETGSTLLLPLLQTWSAAYARTNPGTRISTAGTGSGAGIDAAIAGTAKIGASDAYMSDAEIAAHPKILNIPLAISAQLIAVNLPGITAPIHLSGPVLAGIYSGHIQNWSDPAIAALNRDLPLPHHAIVPIHRAEASGDTFVFTQFLTFSTPGWESGPGYGTTVDWPTQGATATGNAGMVQALQSTPYAVAYVGSSFETQLATARLATAMLLNEAGQYVLPTPQTIEAAAASLTPRTPPDERLTLVYAPGDNAYPLINYEYAVVRAHPGSAATAAAIRDFLLWTVTPGQGNDPALLTPAHFTPLPTEIRALSETQIARIR